MLSFIATHNQYTPFLSIYMYRSLVFAATHDYYYFAFNYFDLERVPDEGYSRNAPFEVTLTSMNISVRCSVKMLCGFREVTFLNMFSFVLCGLVI